MREIKRIKSALGLSILVLAHNPRRDNSRPLTISGLNGAGIMCNFADSVFAVGQSRIDSSFRYIKLIKSRSTDLGCDEKNVLVGEIRKWEANFLAFRFYKFSPESGHLAKKISRLIETRAYMIKEMSGDGMTQRDIAAKLGISLGSVNRYLNMAWDDADYIDCADDFSPEYDEPTPEAVEEIHRYMNDYLQNLEAKRRRGISPPAGRSMPAVSADATIRSLKLLSLEH